MWVWEEGSDMCAYALQAAAAVLEAFPPRGIIRLLPPEHTSHGKPQMERLVAEEYILDTMTFFEGDRVQCAQRLASEPFCCLVLLPCYAQHAIGPPDIPALDANSCQTWNSEREEPVWPQLRVV